MTQPLAVIVAAKALDGLSMRMAALAQNLANASTTTYQPIRVDFEQALRVAAGQGTGDVAALRLDFTAGKALPAGEDRRIDLIVADAADTSTRYSALVDMIARRLALNAAGIGGTG